MAEREWTWHGLTWRLAVASVLISHGCDSIPIPPDLPPSPWEWADLGLWLVSALLTWFVAVPLTWAALRRFFP